MKPTVLMAQLPVQTEATLLVLGQQLALRMKSVPSICYRASIRQLLNDEEPTYLADITVTEPMLLMSGLDDVQTSTLLQELNQRHIAIPLIASLTDAMDVRSLSSIYHELCHKRDV